MNVLGRVVSDLNWLCHAYCLMITHYHLLIETPEGNPVEMPRQQRYAASPPLSELLPASFTSKSARNEAIIQAIETMVFPY